MKNLKKKIIGGVIASIALLGDVFAQNAGGAWQWWFFWQRTDVAPNVPATDQWLTGEGLLNSIKTFINYVLGLLAVIALVVLLWWGFQMVTAAGDDNKYKKWFTILKQAGIGLILIGLAWLIVSFFFYIVNVMVGG